jgi:sugar-specific transcriptional regulator TrmB
MDEIKALEDAGMTNAESRIYLTLLKNGPMSVGEIIRETGLYSSVIYNSLQRLTGEGLASFMIKGGVKTFSASDPNALLEHLKEKEKNVSDAIERFKSLFTLNPAQPVLIFEGWEAARTASQIIEFLLLAKFEISNFNFTPSGLPDGPLLASA